ncbi:MAG TPA: response regulator [Candidatus Didemnitutus sp.]|nr:response regulator [Candidatus Didemnitutus sp.]
MNTWLQELCGDAFMPHGQCYLWNPGLVWLHAVSDSLIALAYYSIPLVLLHLVRQRRDLPYPGLFLMFGAFIIACGTTHLMEVWTIWQPHYVASGLIKAFTAGISLVTAVALVRISPLVLALPGPDQMRRNNEELERRIRVHTADLASSNESLRAEISHREQAEAEVRRLNRVLEHRVRELQTLFDVLPIGVGISDDASCERIRTNRAFSSMLGLPPEANASLSAPTGQAPQSFRVRAQGELLTPDRLPMETAARQNRNVINFEEVIERDDGTRIDVVANAVPLHNEAGAVIGCVATFLDVTDRNRAIAEKASLDHKLQESQKLESLGVLAGGIAHDFNNLLTGVLGNASLLHLETPPESSTQAIITQVETSARRAADLCRQLLAYAGKGRFVIQRIDINHLINETTHLINLSVGKHCVLRQNLAVHLPPVNADATQLRQIIMNLVINASEAIGPRSGVIGLSTGVARVDDAYGATLHPGTSIAPGDYVFLEVSDNGSGMEPATVARIFDPFFTTKFTGRGLGLAAVLGIIRGHKGAIKVYSEPGRGTTFKVLLPVAEGSAESTTSTSPGFSEPPWRGQGTVLVVDDEETVRTVCARMLERMGYNVVLASDGREAVDKFRVEPARYHLVLLDLTMPHLDGEETFRQLRHLHPGVKVILMSGFNQQDAVSRFTGKGLAGFLQKPFETDMLVAAIRQVILKS